MQASGKSSSAPSISRYFRDEWKVLAVVTVTGILYNVGLVAGPWLEGLLAQCLADIFQGLADAGAMIRLAAIYVFVICFVQGMRALKRLYVRKFANNVNRRMKRTLYANLLCGGGAGSSRADVGDVMTRAVADVDDCVEGMRKFTTELFDTGVVMAAYIVVLLAQDWRIALLALIFPPISYVLAAWLRKPVTGAVASAKKEISAMAGMALDRVEGALTYRIFGLEARRDELFEEDLARYERAETKANVLSSSLMPLYQASHWSASSPSSSSVPRTSSQASGTSRPSRCMSPSSAALPRSPRMPQSSSTPSSGRRSPGSGSSPIWGRSRSLERLRRRQRLVWP